MKAAVLSLVVVCLLNFRCVVAIPALQNTIAAECHFELNADTFAANGPVFNSPGWNGEPSVDARTCTWIIEAPESKVVILHVNSLSLDLTDNCAANSVLISNVDSGDALIRVCGQHCTPTVVLADRRASVQLISLAGFTGIGFQMTYSFITTVVPSDVWNCGCPDDKPGCFEVTTNIQEETNTETECTDAAPLSSGGFQILSPAYPSSYPPNANCTWTIMGAVDTSVVLYFGDQSLPDDDCLSIFYGAPGDCSSYCNTLCGERQGFPVVATTNAISITFQSDGVQQGDAFILHYSFTHATCGPSILTTSEFSIASPGYPLGYPPALECTWVIQLNPSEVIQITFEDLQLEEGCSDFVSVYDVSSNQCGDQCQVKWCESDGDAPTSFTTTGHIAILTFKTDSQNSAARGFRLSYRAIGDTAENGTSTIAPSDPNIHTDIIQGNGTHVNNDNTTDAFHLEEGASGNATSQSPYQIIKVVNTTGVLQTPNFPDDYPSNANIGWEITAPDGQNIVLYFNLFEIEESSGCTKDQFTLYAGPFSEYCGGCDCAGYTDCTQFCTPNTGYTWTSQKNVVTILFHSDDKTTKRGFQISYSHTMADCGRSDAPPLFGWLGWAEYEEEEMVCTWVVKASPEQVIAINIESLTLPEVDVCEQNHLQLTDDVAGTCQEPNCVRLCGQQSNYKWTSSNNVVIIKWLSGSGSRVQLSYAVSTPVCGDVFLTADTGVIESVGYPEEAPYPDSLYCSWIILPENNQAMVQLTIETLDIIPSVDCAGDVLEIYQGNFTSACEDNCKSLCTQNQLYPEPLWYGNRVSLRFKTDKADSATGFRILFTSTGNPETGHTADQYRGMVTQGINGTNDVIDNPPSADIPLTPSSGDEQLTCPQTGSEIEWEIHSPGFPNFYPPNLRCMWNLTAPDGQIVELTFVEIDIFYNGTCIDMLMLYDGHNIGDCAEDGEVWCTKLCYGFAGGYVWKSRTELVSLEFVTDDADNAKGFKIKYTFI